VALQAAHDALSGLPSVACASFAFPSLIDLGVQTRCGRILVWTDGSCLFPTISLLARVGVGVHYAVDSPCNVSVGLPGPDQSNNRAELTAIAIVVASSTSPVDIRTDSKWAADRLRWLQEDASRFPLHSWSHIDIWRQIHGSPNFRRCFDHQGVSCPWCVFKWIKGHATAEDVAAGIISVRDRAGNYAADNLAGAAATAASPDTAACDSYFSRLRCTVMLQAWMLKRWATRAKYLRHYQPAHYDDDDDPLDDAWHGPHDDDSQVRVRSAQSSVGDVALDAGHSNVGGSLGSGARPSHSVSRQRSALTSDQLKEAARFSGENMLYGILDVDWDTRQTVWPAWPWHLVSGNVNAYTFPIHSDSATDWPIAHIPFAAIDWYFRSLQWCESEGCSVTAQELAIDFYGSTHVNVIPQTSSRQDPTIENMTRFFVIAWTSYCRLIGSTVTHGTWRLKSLKQVRAFGIRDSSGLQGARPMFLSGDFVPRVIYHRMAAWSTSSGLSHDRRTGAWKCSIPVAAALPCRIWDSSATLVQPSRKRIHAKSSSSVSPCLSHAHAVVLPIGCVASSFAPPRKRPRLQPTNSKRPLAAVSPCLSHAQAVVPSIVCVASSSVLPRKRPRLQSTSSKRPLAAVSQPLAQVSVKRVRLTTKTSMPAPVVSNPVRLSLKERNRLKMQEWRKRNNTADRKLKLAEYARKLRLKVANAKRGHSSSSA